MKKFLGIIVIVLLGIAAFVLIKQKTIKTPEPVRMANPASIFCLDNGGTLEIITQADGGEIGMCTLVDGTECEERAYFRGECGSTSVTNEKQDVHNEDELVICTMEYMPVCASVAIQCVTEPCDPVEQTFGNRCMMNANKLATFLHEGECETK